VDSSLLRRRDGPQDLLYRDVVVTRLKLVDTTSLSSGIVIVDCWISTER